MKRGTKPLLKQLEIYFIKHRKAVCLDANIQRYVKSTYSICGASPTLIAALEDPNIEVPGIDPKIPKMDRVQNGDPRRPAIPHSNNEHKQISH
jgi:hypothetical protein